MYRFILIWFLIIPAKLLAQKSIIKVNAPGYSGKEIIFYEYFERILNQKKEVFRIYPDEKGFSTTEIELKEVKYLFTELEGYRFFFYAEPYQVYTLNFPAPYEKSLENKLSPFFSPVPIHLNVLTVPSKISENCVELNDAIRNYDNSFNPFYDTQLLNYYSFHQNRENLDSFNLTIKSSCPPCNEEYYSQYVRYKKGILDFTVAQYNINELITDYFTNNPVALSVPPWWELFTMVFDKYFTYLSSGRDFDGLFRIITAGDYWALDELLSKAPGLKNDTIRTLVMISELHKLFFDRTFPQTTLPSLLDSISLHSASLLCRELSEAVKLKNTRLLPGATAPSFLLTDAFGELYTSDTFSGKYIYLGFCNPDSPGSMKEFEYLQYLHLKHNKFLAVITVFDELPIQELESIREKFGYEWLLTKSHQPNQAQKKYNVFATPQFFLIGPDGAIALSPAPLPSEGFENALFLVMRKKGDI